ncbi:MAG: NADP-dependent malic enzyme [Acidimicrobiia bacterium]|nr:NADP-dependent malic enzyme [Acidimicrobiia bacterium]
MTDKTRFSEALEYHSRGRPGKTEIRATKPTATQADLSLAYTPGVAEPSLEIARDPELAFRYTNRGNLVAVVSNGTAVLGLGNIGPLGSKPVMEGKAVLFKRFADIDVFDLEVGSEDPEDVIRFCELLEPTVAGINLEDIKAPEAFYVEETLKERLDIPVFHDDQHGTAIIGGAAFMNAVELARKDIGEVKVVFNGAGAAGIATAKFFVTLGVNPENLMLCDSHGVIHTDRDDLTPVKEPFARETDARTLAEAMVDADVFVGVSVGGVVDGDMVRSMAKDPILFALANPNPEIPYPEAVAARPDVIAATGRSDFPNQVNNVLGFPFIFRGALDVRARGITESMKVAAAKALAELAKEPVHEGVLRAYDVDRLDYGREYLIPKPFDPRVLWHVAPAVAKAATDEGIARLPLDDVDAYTESLKRRFQASYALMRRVTVKARERAMRVVFPHGADVRIVRAARRVVDEGIAEPIILGPVGEVGRHAAERGIALDGVEIIDPHQEQRMIESFAEELVKIRGHKGMIPEDARRIAENPNLFASMMLRSGVADAVLGGLTTYYPDTLRPALWVLPLEPGRTRVSALYIMSVKGKPFFFTDCAVNIEPTAVELAEIAVAAAKRAQRDFDVNPRVAMISYSDFGSATGREPVRIREAIDLVRSEWPELAIDGEMHAETAVSPVLLGARHPFNELGDIANVLVFPNLTAANAAYQLLHRLGGAERLGPILSGMAKSVHVLQRDSDVGDIVNMTAIAALDAQRKG